jgi:hypothetical protein
MNKFRKVIKALLFRSTSLYVNMSRVDMSEIQRHADNTHLTEWMVSSVNEKMIRYGVTVGRTGVCNLINPSINTVQDAIGDKTIINRRITVQPPIGELTLIGSRFGQLYDIQNLHAEYFNKTLTFAVRAPGKSMSSILHFSDIFQTINLAPIRTDMKFPCTSTFDHAEKQLLAVKFKDPSERLDFIAAGRADVKI